MKESAHRFEKPDNHVLDEEVVEVEGGDYPVPRRPKLTIWRHSAGKSWEGPVMLLRAVLYVVVAKHFAPPDAMTSCRCQHRDDVTRLPCIVQTFKQRARTRTVSSSMLWIVFIDIN